MALLSSTTAGLRHALRAACPVALTTTLALLAAGCSPKEGTPTVSPTRVPSATPPPTPIPATDTPTPEYRPPPTLPPDSGDASRLKVIGQLWGDLNAVSAEGDLAFVSVGPRLIALDVADPTHPRPVGQSEVLPGVIKAIHLHDGYAYVTTNQSGAWIVNVHDPARPGVVGYLATPGDVAEVLVLGKFAYLADVENGLWVFDVSDPGNPREVWSYDPSESYLSGVSALAASGRYLYLAAPNEGLVIMDASQPSRPHRVGEVPFEELPVGYSPDVLAVEGHAYVAEEPDGMAIVDVAIPASPSVLTVYSSLVGDLEPSDGFVYSVGAGGTLSVMSLARPAAPRRLGSLDLDVAEGSPLSVSGDFAYVAGGGRGLKVIDISDPSDMKQVGAYPATAFAEWPSPSQVVIQGDRVYLFDAYNGEFTIVDTSDPTDPQKLGYVGIDVPVGQLAVSESMAYILTRDTQLTFIDVSDPDAIHELEPAPKLGVERILAMAGTRMYVADWIGPLLAFDMSDPTHVRQTAMYAPAGLESINDVFLSDGRAFVSLTILQDGEYKDELHILDASDPGRLRPVGIYTSPSSTNIRGSYIAGDYAYLIDWGELRIVDISSPGRPREIGTYDAQGYLTDVYVVNAFAYLATEDQTSLNLERGGLWLLDVSDPANPTLVDSYDPPDDITTISVSDSFMYLLANRAGLILMPRVDQPLPSP